MLLETASYKKTTDANGNVTVDESYEYDQTRKCCKSKLII